MDDNSINSQFKYNLNMYEIPPTGVANLEEFESLAIERLQLLRVLEQASLKGNKIFSEEWKKCVEDDLIKLDLFRSNFVRLMNGLDSQTELDLNARKADHLSHFILRLAYCRTEETRRWFIDRELEWFKLRFIVQNQNTIDEFLKSNQLIYFPISDADKDALFNELSMSTADLSDVNIKATNFFKVPFTQVPSLIKNRRVLLKAGFAYIPNSELVVCVQNKLKATLNEALKTIVNRLPSVDDERINLFLLNMNSSYNPKNYAAPSIEGGVDIGSLDAFSRKHYPLCMRHVHETLRSNHHLKYHCRLQYGLFLKGIGVTLEDALEFWKEEFTKRMDLNKFQKGYVYHIKHSYGKVGSKINYTPFSCMKLINNPVGPGGHHGCPFKVWDFNILRQQMIEYGVPDEGIEAVIELVKNGQPQIACTKYFEYTHSMRAPSTVIDHPNQYFEESVNMWDEKKKAWC